MDTQSIKSMLKSQLEDLGVAPGGVLLVHTSLKGLGGAAPDLVLQALLELLTPAGTLLVPALSYRTVTAEQPFFHLQHTPASGLCRSASEPPGRSTGACIPPTRSAPPESWRGS